MYKKIISTVIFVTFFSFCTYNLVFAALSFTKINPPNPNSGNQQTASLILDIDKDGLNDIVITERTSSPSVVWYKRVGDNWQKKVIDNGSLRIEAGGTYHDIDSDGDLDILFGQDSRGNQMWWWENPYPNYESPWTRRTIKNSGSNKHHDQMFGDVDGDGKAELITWNQGAKKLFLAEIPSNPMQSGEWNFTQIYSWSSGNENEGIDIADVDKDGKLDIVGAGKWFKHTGGTNFDAKVVDNGMAFTRSAAGDLVKGGNLELVFVCGDCDGPLNMYEYKEGGWQKKTIENTVIHGHSLRLGDLNNDGNLDIFVGEMGLTTNSPKTRLYLGDGNGNFTKEVPYSNQAHHESRIADLDGNGSLDILAKPYTKGAPGFSVYLNSASGGGGGDTTIDNWGKTQVGNLAAKSVFAVHGDFNGDGEIDIAAGKNWYQNPGSLNGSWQTKTTGAGFNNVALAADFDNDGDVDLFGTKGIGSEANRNLVWAENNGSGVFTIKENIQTPNAGDFIQGIAYSDFGNGKEIILSWHAGASKLHSIKIPANINSNWTFTELAVTSQNEDLSVGDIDNDGDKDIYTGTNWVENKGNNGWEAHSIGQVGTSGVPDRNELADFNNDGKLDGVIGLENGTKIILYTQGNDPKSNWARREIADIVGGGFSMGSGDFDKDGDIDIVVGEHRGSGNNRLIILENTNNGSSFNSVVIDSASTNNIDHHDGANVFDLDKDGDLDIYSLGWYNLKVWVYDNQNSTGSVNPTPTPTNAPSPTRTYDPKFDINNDGSNSFFDLLEIIKALFI